MHDILLYIRASVICHSEDNIDQIEVKKLYAQQQLSTVIIYHESDFY